MSNITVTINAPELAQALLSLANALDSRTAGVARSAQILEGMKEINSPAQPPPQQQGYQQPLQQVAPQQAAVQPIYTPPQQYMTPGQIPQQQAYNPNPQQLASQTVVPTVAQAYTLEQLGVAGTQLVDAGRMTELQQLLASFGVNSMMQLPKEQYGAFATQLRAMGAKI